MTTRIESIHFTADQKLIDFIQKKLDKLDQYHDRIIDAHVILKLENTGQVKDKVVEVKLDIPGDLIVASESSKSFEAAVDEVSSVLKRLLIRHKERVRSH
ncbi:MAG: ribosome-associated translation inhibitor RaiA [Saprospiraceae bacterium]|nr:ribosome-associated translation inhibitor RaiA [Saprospiraceae bacterium]